MNELKKIRWTFSIIDTHLPVDFITMHTYDKICIIGSNIQQVCFLDSLIIAYNTVMSNSHFTHTDVIEEYSSMLNGYNLENIIKRHGAVIETK